MQVLLWVSPEYTAQKLALLPLLAGQHLLLTHEFGDSSFYSIPRSLNKLRSEEAPEETSKQRGIFKPTKAAILLVL